MCLNCGIVLCGRYDNGHALDHSSKNDDHVVCLNTLNGSVYCYKCDDFVINDTSKNALCDLRHELRDDDSLSETSTFESSSTKTQETASTSSSDSGWEEPNRKLRPRKRTTSSNTEVVTKRKTLRKVSRRFFYELLLQKIPVNLVEIKYILCHRVPSDLESFKVLHFWSFVFFKFLFLQSFIFFFSFFFVDVDCFNSNNLFFW